MVSLKKFVESRFYKQANNLGQLQLFMNGQRVTRDHLRQAVQRAVKTRYIKLKSDQRLKDTDLEALVPIVVGTRYKPGAGPLYEEDFLYYRNAWRPSDVVHSGAKVDQPPDMFEELLERLFSVPEERAYVVGWLAHLVRFPESPCNLALLFRSEQGLGKNVFWDYVVSPLVGDQNANTVSLSQLTSNFNDSISDSVAVLVDELYSDRKRTADRLKPLVTQRTMWAERKGVDGYRKDCYYRIVAASNDQRPLHIEPGDRRWFVPEYATHKIDLQETASFVGLFVEWIESDPSALVQIRDYLEGVEIPDLHVAPMTKAKERIVATDKSSEKVAIVEDFLRTNGEQMVYTVSALSVRFAKWKVADQEIIEALRLAGFESYQRRINGTKARWWLHPDAYDVDGYHVFDPT